MKFWNKLIQRFLDIIINNLRINYEKIGEKNREVQINETAICNSVVILNPSSMLENYPNTQCSMGGIDSENNFLLKLVENKKSSTILTLFNQKIKKESIIITNGYPSYSSAVNDFGSIHAVVKKSSGFKNEEGYTTNKIVNF